MTPEAQRSAIAEACGWTDVKLDGPHSTVIFGLQPKSNIRWGIPDYLNSLDAMHEAEKTLDDFQHHIFRQQLHEACGHNGRAIYSATAARRAKAFLRTLNLWTDEA